MSSVYQINKGVGQPVMFKGLKAQYIWWLAAAIGALLLGFAILYICGVNMFICLGIVGLLGVVAFMKVYEMSNRYGTYGLAKKMGFRQVPKLIRNGSRKVFFKPVKT